MIFEPELETMPRAELEKLQLERLKKLADAESLDDLRPLPFTRKEDLRDSYPLGRLAVPRDQVRRIHGSSGTTGKPTVVPYTSADLDLFARAVARCLAAAGARPGMTLHNAYGYGLFTGGLGFHDGGARLGLTVVPVSGGMTERQLTLILDLRPEILACTPSYALTLACAFSERGVSPRENPLQIALLGAEPWTEAARREIDTGLGVRAVNVYGLSEIIGPGVSGECAEERNGLHVQEDLFLAEIVDPESGERLPDGEQGVLVLTTLTKEALPLVRYWTGDICSLDRSPCSCGRTLARMSAPAGRADDMLIIRGVNLYPSQVESILGRLPGLTPHWRLVVDRPETLDVATVEVETAEPQAAASNELRARAEGLLAQTIGCTIGVVLKEPGELPQSEGGKLQRVEDRRR